MQEEEITNEIILEGKIITDVRFSHSKLGREFFIFYLEQRKDFYKNTLPIIIDKNTPNFSMLEKGKFVKIIGNLRSYDFIEKNKLHLKLRVFVRNIFILENVSFLNTITLVGYLCKNVQEKAKKNNIYFLFLLAINRNYILKQKSDYIPCILIKKQDDKKLDKSLYKVGTKVKIVGTFKSRDYFKKDLKKRTTLEVIIKDLKLI